ncbi:Gfo/Idh/MocA family protein [Nostocoides jenkinsii]|uniref:Streptomycin biosynthesis protein strI n=1 Tax=Nostocoides jenkinsii Ben 74 TaxID=1193518 RepID=A0A077MEC4_9MICO|nr:Gfo/Idh/MocA family oxidoreductase [Tetrasphaera jenkinsii]CCI52678.1 Streptomycin biosynthesis protein strI [Tetrasphaera jenkinsii Ben 74]CCI53243.1 Streptomycin biosynthesis protein strI [Tetrasphaera jenkinsii Ben 74]
MRIGITGTGRIGAFHAKTLLGVPGVDGLVVTDVVPESAAKVAADLGQTAVPDLDAVLAAGVDALVVTSSSPGHAPAVRAGLAAGIPIFCEKPVAAELGEAIELARLEAAASTPVHIGFQRRFDAGYRRLRDAVQSGELGFVHSIRAATHDQAPPHAAYIPTSGGLFRDCSVHDFDIVRFVSGREVASVFATGGNKGAEFFREAGDVDTGAAILTLDDGTMVTVTATRYNGAGHDVRMEVHGSTGSMAAGLDDTLAIRSAQPGATFPAGPAHQSFMERFQPAYVAELTYFVDVARGVAPSPCTVADGLAAARIAEAAQRSKDSGTVVTLTEIPGLRT